MNPAPLAVYRVAEGSVSSNILGMSRTAQTTYDRALARGRLSPLQRVMARRYRRVQSAVELWEELFARLPAAIARTTPTCARVVLEHPNRWWRWLRIILAARASARPR